MNLFTLNLFRGSLFKQMKFLFSSPQKAQRCLYISDAGTISKEVLPLATGYISPMEIKKSWMAVNLLKFKLYKNGEPVEDEQVLLISDRSYIPLDPNEIIDPEDKEKFTSLDDIAYLRYSQALSSVGQEADERVDLAQTIAVGGFILGIIMLIITFFRGC